MKIILDDAGKHLRFAPLTFAKPVSELRVGIFTAKERLEKLLPNVEVFYETEEYLSEKYINTSKPNIIINASIILSSDLLKEILNLSDGDVLYDNETWIAKKGIVYNNKIDCKSKVIVLNNLWDLFNLNDKIIDNDFEIIKNKRKTSKISLTNTIIGNPNHIFIEEGAHVEASVLNTKSGPIYIAKDAEIMEGTLIRGPFVLCESACVKMGAKIYGATTIGPFCKVGGEISNSIFQAYSNKGHDGFVGNSLIGEWCNLGADTNTSNLKNNYSKVSFYSYEYNEMRKTDNQFMGLIMGDHCKSGINTMFNTGTVVGFSSNIFGGNFPDKHIPSFSWGGSEKIEIFNIDKALEVANAMMKRRSIELTEHDKNIFNYLYKNIKK